MARILLSNGLFMESYHRRRCDSVQVCDTVYVQGVEIGKRNSYSYESWSFRWSSGAASWKSVVGNHGCYRRRLENLPTRRPRTTYHTGTSLICLDHRSHRSGDGACDFSRHPLILNWIQFFFPRDEIRIIIIIIWANMVFTLVLQDSLSRSRAVLRFVIYFYDGIN